MTPEQNSAVAHPKQRVVQHVMEDRSRAIVRDALPPEWVVRDYRPDYGIDLAVDLFEPLPGKRGRWVALGESFLVQVKATETVRPTRLRVRVRPNVERVPLGAATAAYNEIDVARVRLDTSLLATVQAMGAAVPVLLFLVELSTRRIYFVCLNDLIDKVILPEDPRYAEKRTRTIHVPLRNLVDERHPASVRPLAAYAKRAKLYAAFQKFAYQDQELNMALDLSDSEGRNSQKRGHAFWALVRHFLTIVLRYDFWTRAPELPMIGIAHDQLTALQRFLGTADAGRSRAELVRYLREAPHAWFDIDLMERNGLLDDDRLVRVHAALIWQALAELGRMYEAEAREWFLPV